MMNTITRNFGYMPVEFRGDQGVWTKGKTYRTLLVEVLPSYAQFMFTTRVMWFLFHA